MIRAAETQRVHVSDRTRAHREDVAQDAADPGRRALIGLDVAGVVVALHLEDGGLAITDVDHARVLAGAANDPRRLGRKLLEVESARLVRAMLGPHHRKDAELDQIGLTAQCTEHALVFFGAEAMRLDDVRGDSAHGLALSHVLTPRLARSGTSMALPP